MALGSLSWDLHGPRNPFKLSLGPPVPAWAVGVLFSVPVTGACFSWPGEWFFFSPWPCHYGPVHQSLACTWPWLSSLQLSWILNSGPDLCLASLPWAFLMIWALRWPQLSSLDLLRGAFRQSFKTIFATGDFHEHPWCFTVLAQLGVN